MMVSLQDGDKTYLQVELIEGREELGDCTNAFVRYVDAVSHLQTTMMTIAIMPSEMEVAPQSPST